MIFKQFYLNCLAHASYLIGDDRSGTAVVVDPRRDVQPYLDEAVRHGLQIRHVVLTHLHADFVAGHLELRERAGAAIYLGARARAEYAFTPMKTGDTLELGDVRLQVLETPGHTFESISILVYDLARSADAPAAVLTGDTLFVGDVGRPDLRASLGWSADELGRWLYRSVHTLLNLPDDTVVYPAHGAGSLCGKHIGTETASTIGNERRTNYAVQPMSEEQFVALVTANQPDAPAYFTYDAVLNAMEHATLDEVLERELKPLSLSRVMELMAQGAQLLDTRDPGEFASGHVEGSINIGLNGQYATWAGTLLDGDTPIVIVTSPGREAEAAMRLGRIGFDNVAGFLEGGMEALSGSPWLVKATLQISAFEAERRLSDETLAPFILDVRTGHEWQQQHIATSVNVPLNKLLQQAVDLPRQRDIVVHCAAGYRSSIAASLLERAGFTRVEELTGGIRAWEAAKLRPVA